MERSDDASSLPATVNYSDESSPRHHPPSSSADVTAWGRPTCPGVRRVACSGDGKEEESDSHHSLRGPIRCSPEAREAGDGQGARPSPGDDVTRTDSTVCSHSMASCTEGSKVNHCYRLDTGGHSGGGATGGTDCHTPPSKASKVNINPVTRESDTDSDTQDGDLTFDLQEVSSDDETFITEPPPPQGEMSLPPAASRSRNTYECGRRQSAPGQLVQDGSQAELQSRRPGIVDYFSSRQRSISHSVPGWKLFGKVPPRQIPSKHSRIIQQIAAVSLSSPSSPDLRRSAEYEARQVAAQSSPTQHAAGQQQSRRNVEFEPLSTTALILEDRPPNLPAKSAEETQRHRQQYEQMVAGAKRRELKEAQRRQQQMKERFRQEDVIANTALIWNKHILPHWDAMKSSRRARDLWWAGLPPSVRGRVWSLAIGNELNITAELYEIFLSRAKEKWRNLGETQADAGAPPADSESSLQLIRRDVSRTLASLCVFQKGGPYHDLLQSILGAYTCYRPDVGYMQGMASLAAMLILNMDEVEAFISFSNLINKPCQLTFYRVDHQLMFRYFGAFEVFFKENLPRLFLHFQSTGVTSDLYLMDWVLSLYTKPLPLDVACRVWDVFLRDGEEFLFRTGLGILRLHQDVLLQMDLISIAQFLARLPDEELLSDRLFSCISATPMLSGNRKWIQVQQLNKPEDSML